MNEGSFFRFRKLFSKNPEWMLQKKSVKKGLSSVYGSEIMLTSGQNGSEREKETEGKGAEECSTMRIIRWMC